MQDNEFAGRLDFNQHTREINVSDILLEVQSAQTKRDGCVCYPSALNFVELTNPLPAMKSNLSVIPVKELVRKWRIEPRQGWHFS